MIKFGCRTMACILSLYAESVAANFLPTADLRFSSAVDLQMASPRRSGALLAWIEFGR